MKETKYQGIEKKQAAGSGELCVMWEKKCVFVTARGG